LSRRHRSINDTGPGRPDPPKALAATDRVLLAADRERFDDALIKANAPRIVDTPRRHRERTLSAC